MYVHASIFVVCSFVFYFDLKFLVCTWNCVIGNRVPQLTFIGHLKPGVGPGAREESAFSVGLAGVELSKPQSNTGSIIFFSRNNLFNLTLTMT